MKCFWLIYFTGKNKNAICSWEARNQATAFKDHPHSIASAQMRTKDILWRCRESPDRRKSVSRHLGSKPKISEDIKDHDVETVEPTEDAEDAKTHCVTGCPTLLRSTLDTLETTWWREISEHLFKCVKSHSWYRLLKISGTSLSGDTLHAVRGSLNEDLGS